MIAAPPVNGSSHCKPIEVAVLKATFSVSTGASGSFLINAAVEIGESRESP